MPQLLRAAATLLVSVALRKPLWPKPSRCIMAKRSRRSAVSSRFPCCWRSAKGSLSVKASISRPSWSWAAAPSWSSEALHDRTADVTHVATAFLIQAAMKGSDAVAVATEFDNPIYSLMAKPEIKTYADLKGKLLGLAAETGTITISIRRLRAMHRL